MKNKKSSKKTLCVRCRKNKGVNKWFCNSCHKLLTNLYGDLETYPTAGITRTIK